MGNIATTKMSSKGQIVIPEEIRKELGLEPGSQFVVIGEKDVVILKSIKPLSLNDFDDMVRKARKAAKNAGLKKSDIADIIASVRGKS